jgi:hypothetical protein
MKMRDEKKLDWADIAKLLNKEGSRTSAGKNWRAQNVGRVYHVARGAAKAPTRKSTPAAKVEARGFAKTAINGVKGALAHANGKGLNGSLNKVVGDFFGKLKSLGVDLSKLEKTPKGVEVTYVTTTTATVEV